MAKLTFKHNRLAVALGIVTAAVFAGAAPAQAQNMSSSDTSTNATQQSDQNVSGAVGSTDQAQPGSASASSQNGTESSGSSGLSGNNASGSSDMSSGASGTAGTTSSSGYGSAGTSASPSAGTTTGMSNGTSSSSRDMSGGAAVSGTGTPGTGIVPGSSGSDNATGASASINNGQASAMTFSQGNLSSSDRALVNQLAQDNMAELQLAQLAQNKSTNDQVRNFAQQMIDDHTRVANQLQQLAQAKNITLPQSLDRKHRSEEQKLGKLSGQQFDRQYLARAGTSDHSKVHSLLEKIGRSAKDQDLRQLAASLQPDIDKHLQLAQEARRNLAGATSSGSSSTNGSTSSGASSSTMGGSSNDIQQQNNASPSSDQSSGASTSGSSNMGGAANPSDAAPAGGVDNR